MQKSTFYGLAIFLVIIISGFIFLKPNNAAVVGTIDSDVIQGEMQRVVLSQNGYNYNDITAKVDKPIAVSADNSVKGCLRSAAFNINGKKYSKYLQTSEDTLELPALSKGTYTFSCSMGMGFGKLVVE